ncbi:adenylate kinase [Mucilaginibacter terrenus]|uniref:Adenylate kinase n=1 Tax=Mucilaginibacter terrenus TaxID=2482727 RepID=A0A3E2NVD5_9SPHI|nr:shikimate kinase [Mucilaginibacter terrenus]RFZ84968.1 adenylate kinase [Mucilaginibacter terrenus]
MKIQIMGASCAGSTTLGRALSERLDIPYFDTDEYFWETTEVPYTVKRNPAIRNRMLLNDMAQHQSWILGGSVIKWGDVFWTMFDLVVFLYIPADIRIKRLIAREEERYGDAIYNDPVRAKLFRDFVDWAAEYDNPDFSGRNVKAHRDWLTVASGRKIEISGDTTINERIDMVVQEISRLT